MKLDPDAWLADVARAATLSNCTYLHAAALRRTKSFRDDLLSALRNAGLSPVIIQWSDFPDGGWDDLFPETSEVEPGTIFLLWAPEDLAEHRYFREILGQSRPRGQAMLISGFRIMVVSARPKIWFPEPNGSSLIADATKIHQKPVDASLLSLIDPELDPLAAVRIAGFAGGSLALAEHYLALENKIMSSNAKRKDAENFLKVTLRNAFAELGAEALALLDQLVLEGDSFEVEEVDLPSDYASIFEDSGLVRVDDTLGTIQIFALPWRQSARERLIEAIEETVVPPQNWQLIASSLFTLERSVRMALATHLRQMHGDSWRVEGTGQLADRVLMMARGDGHSASGVSEVPAPMDWLLLEELFDLAADCADTAGTVGGLTKKDWQRQAGHLIPIRNRVTHMRLPRPDDLAQVRRSLRFVRTRFSNSSLDFPLPRASLTEM